MKRLRGKEKSQLKKRADIKKENYLNTEKKESKTNIARF